MGGQTGMKRIEYCPMENIKDIKKVGRPKLYSNQEMRQTAIWLPSEMIIWIKKNGLSMSKQIREMIQEKIDLNK